MTAGEISDVGTAGGSLQAPRGTARAWRARAAQLPGGPRWRALLEARWQDRLQKVTELSLAFHDAGSRPEPHREPSARRLMRRATAVLPPP